RARQPGGGGVPRRRVSRHHSSLRLPARRRPLAEARGVHRARPAARGGRGRGARLARRRRRAPRSGGGAGVSTLRERAPTSYALAAPAGLWMLAALVVPTIFIAWVSLWAARGFTLASPLTVANYAKFFARPAYVRVLGDTVQQALTMMLITGVLGYAIAYFLVVRVRHPRLQLGLFLLLVVPFWTSALIRTIGWIPFLGVNGVINQALLLTGLVDQPVEAFLFSRTGITLSQVSFYTLLATGPVVYTLRNIPPSLPEAAQC